MNSNELILKLMLNLGNLILKCIYFIDETKTFISWPYLAKCSNSVSENNFHSNYDYIIPMLSEWPKSHESKLSHSVSEFFFGGGGGGGYTPRKLCLWWGILFSRCSCVCPCVRASVRNIFFFFLIT